MEDLYTGMGAYWVSVSELTTFFTGGFHLIEAPKEYSQPYCVVGASEAYRPTWMDDIEEYRVIFWVHTSGVNATSAIQGAALIKSHFDDHRFDVDGWHHLKFHRDMTPMPRRVDNRWEIELQYESILEKESE